MFALRAPYWWYHYYFPFSFLLGAAVWTYGVALPIAASHPGVYGYALAASILFWVQAVVMIYVAARFSFDWITDRISGWQAFVGWVDLWFALPHAWAGVFMSMWLLDGSPGKTAQIIVPGPTATYDIFSSLLLVSMLLTDGVGFARAFPVSALAEVWTIVSTRVGVIWLFVLAGGALRRQAEQWAVGGFTDTPFGGQRQQMTAALSQPRPAAEIVYVQDGSGVWRLPQEFGGKLKQ